MTPQDILTQLGIEWSSSHRHGTGGWIQLQSCPYCHSGKYHLGLNLKFGYLNCWKCGRHNLAHALSLLCNTSYKEIKALVEDIEVIGKIAVPEFEVRNIKVELPGDASYLTRRHREYLESRGFDPREVKKRWKIQGTSVTGGVMAWRIIIPIYQQGKLVSWTSRAIGNSEPKYFTCPNEQAAWPRNEILYGIDAVRHVAYVVEGPLDVWAIGFGAVCPLGTEISLRQIRRIAEFPVRVICFDPEPAAQRRAAKIASMLSSFRGETYQVELSSGDPGEADKSEIKELRAKFG